MYNFNSLKSADQDSVTRCFQACRAQRRSHRFADRLPDDVIRMFAMFPRDGRLRRETFLYGLVEFVRYTAIARLVIDHERNLGFSAD